MARGDVTLAVLDAQGRVLERLTLDQVRDRIVPNLGASKHPSPWVHAWAEELLRQAFLAVVARPTLRSVA